VFSSQEVWLYFWRFQIVIAMIPCWRSLLRCRIAEKRLYWFTSKTRIEHICLLRRSLKHWIYFPKSRASRPAMDSFRLLRAFYRKTKHLVRYLMWCAFLFRPFRNVKRYVLRTFARKSPNIVKRLGSALLASEMHRTMCVSDSGSEIKRVKNTEEIQHCVIHVTGFITCCALGAWLSVRSAQ